MLHEQKDGVPPQEELTIVGASIPETETDDQGTVFYHINVTSSFTTWGVSKRFSQFEELHAQLTEEFVGKPLPKGVNLPPKKLKLITSHTDAAFIEERRTLLEAYLKKIVASKETAKSPAVLHFLTTDKRNKLAEEKVAAEPAEDVEVTGVCIPATRTMSDHVLFQIDVSNARKSKDYAKWTVLKRFSQFHDMDNAMRTEYMNEPDFLLTLPYPPERKSKLMHDHMDPNFIEERRVLLESYLQKLIGIDRVARNATFLKFLGVNVD